MVHYRFNGAHPAGLALFAAAMPTIHTVAIALHDGVEPPVARLRDRVRTPVRSQPESVR